MAQFNLILLQHHHSINVRQLQAQNTLEICMTYPEKLRRNPYEIALHINSEKNNAGNLWAYI